MLTMGRTLCLIELVAHVQAIHMMLGDAAPIVQSKLIILIVLYI